MQFLRYLLIFLILICCSASGLSQKFLSVVREDLSSLSKCGVRQQLVKVVEDEHDDRDKETPKYCKELLGKTTSAQDAPSCQKVMRYVQDQLPHCGILKSSNGFVYVDIDDEYIHTLIPFIQEQGFHEPPYFETAALVGAHITVIRADETKKYGIEKIQECGEIVHFTPKECKVVHPAQWQGIDEVYVIVVDAPELDHIRKKYGLPKTTYDFHITIGVKYETANTIYQK